MKKTTWFGLLALAAHSAIAAETTVRTDEVQVTADRFPESQSMVPGSISVIKREDIEATPAISIPDILKTRTGIQINSLYGNEGIDAPVDMRGFGDTGPSNSLILLDGQRLNPIDMGSIQWAAIPLQALERIEIIRGGGSVLYGDHAAGGVINLITDKTGTPHAALTGTLGSYGYRAIDGYASGGNGTGYFNAFLHDSESNGWRENAWSRQHMLSGRGGLDLGDNEAFLDYSFYRQDYGLPGSIASRTFRVDPRRARTPDDTTQKEGYRLRPGISVSLTDSLRLDAEIAVSNESQSSDNVSFGSVFERTLHTVSFTPRLRWQHGLGGLESATTAGIDYYYGRVSSDSTTYASQNADQASRAVYLQNSTRFDQHWSTTVGVRSQNMRQHADQDAYAPFLMPAFRGSSERTVNVYDLGVRYQADAWSAYAKTGTNMRFANTDELFGFDPFTGNPVFAGGLKPQRGRAHEIGGAFKLGTANARLALYRMNLRDEIGFDSVTFANVNFDPTRHEGLEAEMDWRIADDWRALLNYARTVAKFREGPYQDNDIPMVARDKAGVQLAWNGHRLGNYSAQVNYVGPRYFSGDYANARERLSGYTTLDLHANWDLKPLQLNAMVINALDKHYAPYALYSNTFSDYYYFPADSRTFYLSARYDFK